MKITPTTEDVNKIRRDLERLRERIDRTFDLMSSGSGGDTGSSHNPVSLGAGSDPALLLSASDQVLILSDVLTPTEGDARYMQSVSEGPGTDITGTTLAPIIGIGLDSVLLSAGDGSPAAEYATITLACAAASSGATILLAPATYAESFSVPEGVTVRGESREDCVITGAVTLGDGSTLECLSIVRSIDDAGVCYGVIDGGGTATITDITIDVANATGAAYAVYMANGGRIDAWVAELLAETGSVGYAAYVSAGDFYLWSGVARGTTALQPYFT